MPNGKYCRGTFWGISLDVDTIETNRPILRKGKIEQEEVGVYLSEHIQAPTGVSDSLNNDLEKSEAIGFSILETGHYIDFCFSLMQIFNKGSLGTALKPSLNNSNLVKLVNWFGSTHSKRFALV